MYNSHWNIVEHSHFRDFKLDKYKQHYISKFYTLSMQKFTVFNILFNNPALLMLCKTQLKLAVAKPLQN